MYLYLFIYNIKTEKKRVVSSYNYCFSLSF